MTLGLINIYKQAINPELKFTWTSVKLYNKDLHFTVNLNKFIHKTITTVNWQKVKDINLDYEFINYEVLVIYIGTKTIDLEKELTNRHVVIF